MLKLRETILLAESFELSTELTAFDWRVTAVNSNFASQSLRRPLPFDLVPQRETNFGFLPHINFPTLLGLPQSSFIPVKPERKIARRTIFCQAKQSRTEITLRLCVEIKMWQKWNDVCIQLNNCTFQVTKYVWKNEKTIKNIELLYFVFLSRDKI